MVENGWAPAYHRALSNQTFSIVLLDNENNQIKYVIGSFWVFQPDMHCIACHYSLNKNYPDH